MVTASLRTLAGRAEVVDPSEPADPLRCCHRPRPPSPSALGNLEYLLGPNGSRRWKRCRSCERDLVTGAWLRLVQFKEAARPR
jgi:hypothetical protein